MPPKIVTCSICGQTVPKSQTICIAPDVNPPKRACKTHDGVKQKANALREHEGEKKRGQLKIYIEGQEAYQDAHFRAHGKYDQTTYQNKFMKNYREARGQHHQTFENTCCICGEVCRPLKEFKKELLAAVEIAQKIDPNFDINNDNNIAHLGIYNRILIDDKFIFPIDVDLRGRSQKILDAMRPEFRYMYDRAAETHESLIAKVCNKCTPKFEHGVDFNIDTPQVSNSEIVSQTQSDFRNHGEEINKITEQRFDDLRDRAVNYMKEKERNG